MEVFDGKVKVTLLSFERNLTKLNVNDSLPRYNKIIVTIENLTLDTIDDLLLTVTRTGSPIGSDNFDVLPIKAFNLEPGKSGKYELKAFDIFNEIFDRIEIRLTTSQDWEDRKKVPNYLNRASEFSKKAD